MGQKDIVTKEIIKEIGRDIALYILGIEIKGEVELIDKEWTRVEKRESDIVFKYDKKIIHISAVALSILCDFEGKNKQMVVNTILKRIKELTLDDDREYQNYLEKVTILSTNRDLEKNVQEGAEMLTLRTRTTTRGLSPQESTFHLYQIYL